MRADELKVRFSIHFCFPPSSRNFLGVPVALQKQMSLAVYLSLPPVVPGDGGSVGWYAVLTLKVSILSSPFCFSEEGPELLSWGDFS